MVPLDDATGVVTILGKSNKFLHRDFDRMATPETKVLKVQANSMAISSPTSSKVSICTGVRMG
jgi:hypothetical protein